jgi:dihydrofolate reductase
MRKLIYLQMMSLDGFIEAEPNKPQNWAGSGEELIRHFLELEDAVDAHLYGRRTYQHLAAAWPAMENHSSAPRYFLEYSRVWKRKPKIVCSKTLRTVEWNSRLVKDKVAEQITELKQQSGENLLLFGAQLASTLIPLGLVDEYRSYVNPVILGGAKPMFPRSDKVVNLHLAKTRAFGCGVVLLHYVDAGDRR